MSHFSGVWAEVEKFYHLLSESTCPIWFIDETQKLEAAKWLVARGVTIPDAKEK